MNFRSQGLNPPCVDFLFFMGAENKDGRTLPPQIFEVVWQDTPVVHTTLRYKNRANFSDTGKQRPARVETLSQVFKPARTRRYYDPSSPNVFHVEVLENRWNTIWQSPPQINDTLTEDNRMVAVLDPRIEAVEKRVGRRVVANGNHYTTVFDSQEFAVVAASTHTFSYQSLETLCRQGFNETEPVLLETQHLQAGGQFGASSKGSAYRFAFYGQEVLLANNGTRNLVTTNWIQNDKSLLLIPLYRGRELVYLFPTPVNIALTPSLDQLAIPTENAYQLS